MNDLSRIVESQDRLHDAVPHCIRHNDTIACHLQALKVSRWLLRKAPLPILGNGSSADYFLRAVAATLHRSIRRIHVNDRKSRSAVGVKPIDCGGHRVKGTH
ncbi:hypothetical protein J6524_29260 [Bradyrhizobium sp. WSM 1738]|uniref:hypothetical protein n=1 Tax=Bradyrhizobium hereditatis TaxID=2821405 RepID=UPI001CE30655|nr:hypothetical protein [Bradyrhizobium hereditatis]MCA6118937.1 hypothetical protein [Bradyrhizobium hereditatis]